MGTRDACGGISGGTLVAKDTEPKEAGIIARQDSLWGL